MRIWGGAAVAGLALAATVVAGQHTTAGTAGDRGMTSPRLLSGQLRSVESKPNMPSARCGYHFELLLASAEGPVRIVVYDRTAPLEKLDDLVDREVDVHVDGNVARSIQLRGVKPVAGDRLANLETVQRC